MAIYSPETSAIPCFASGDRLNGFLPAHRRREPVLRVYDSNREWVIPRILPLATADSHPSESWDDVGPISRDLVVKMTRLDLALRITAREALDPPWFSRTELRGKGISAGVAGKLVSGISP
ncbi:hypothetical protein F4823DRAFT_366539 [Ustulina deusta]|nr:hypothetical protein F4823DRAFT_366539 [Ustulina deusta]